MKILLKDGVARIPIYLDSVDRVILCDKVKYSENKIKYNLSAIPIR